MRLFPKDFDALQQAILQLYEYRDLEMFRQAVPAIFLKLIPADAFWWPEYHVDVAAKQVTVLSFAGSDSSLLERLSELAPRQLLNHPSTQYFLKTGDTTALKLSDFLTLPRLRDSVLYQECYRHLDVERELSGSVFSRRGGAAGWPDQTRPGFYRARSTGAESGASSFRSGASECKSGYGPKDCRSHAVNSLRPDPREREIASWVAKGKTNPEISIILQAAIRTVEKHMERILEKLGVENRASAAVMVAQAAPTGAERKSYIAAQKFWDVQDAPHPPSGHPLPSEGRGMG